MAKYTKYECTVCHRQKTVIQDNLRVMPAECTITKGCQGTLYKVGTSPYQIPTPPVEGVVDWYAPGQNPTYSSTVTTEQFFEIVTTSDNKLTLALLLTNSAAIQNETVRVILEESTTSPVTSTTYIFRPITTVSVITGRDYNGAILRFDQQAINSGLVQVTINGVIRSVGSGPTEVTLQPNQVTINTPVQVGDSILITVLSSTPTKTVEILFTINNSTISAPGSWGNIRWVDQYNIETGNLISEDMGKKWWLYTSDVLSDISPSALLKLTSIMNDSDEVLFPGVLGNFDECHLLLARAPYQNADRLVYDFVDLTTVSTDFLLKTSEVSPPIMFVDLSAIKSVCPPFQLIPGESQSFITNDSFSDISGAANEVSVPKLSSFIIGPI